MRLYHSPTSPYVRKVMILLHECGRLAEVGLVPATGTPVDPGTMPLAQNPLGKIPVLERDDGPALYDSRVICRYLDHRFGSGLYPPEPRLWETLTVEATADGILDAAILARYETVIRPEPLRHAGWIAGQWAKIDRALDTLEGRWADHLDGAFGMGAVAVGCAFGYLDFRFADGDWAAARPRLAAWWAKVRHRPSFTATAPQNT